jgi:hypothetical protein
LSSPSGRDWSCFRKIVNITALSGVGVAAAVGAGVGVCACKPELNIDAASTASAVTNILPRPIARLPFLFLK